MRKGLPSSRCTPDPLDHRTTYEYILGGRGGREEKRREEKVRV
jgi:hypothetical protein